VIGYGSTLHGDDALGPLIAGQVASWKQPRVRALAVQELLPELAAEMATAAKVVFVDASRVDTRVTLTPLRPHGDGAGLGHSLTPGGLLALTAAVYGREPEAYQIAIPGDDFTLGHSLTPWARRGRGAALALLHELA
jgi:hydrogenase maturation protease